MMIQERLKRSNLIMLVVPVAVAGVLLAVGLGVLVLLLETIYLPRLGLTMQDLHTLGEQAEAAFADLKHFVVLYGVVVIAVLLAVGTNLWLTRNLFAHIREPFAAASGPRGCPRSSPAGGLPSRLQHHRQGGTHHFLCRRWAH